MTTEEIKAVITAVDPGAKRYASSKDASAFTIWAEYRRIMPDGACQDDYGWAFEIDRYAKEAEDEIAKAFETALSQNDRISFSYEVDYDPKSGYIRHIFDCEGI